jgi:hypothetical protein
MKVSEDREMSQLTISAIIIALNEQGFIAPCLRAIYPFVTRIYLITNYDTDWHGHELEPDRTVETVVHFDDPDKKIILLFNRKILDETIHRNWAISADQGLYEASHFRFRPHAHSLADIRRQSPPTDFFWVIDADEIYDPETIPGALDFVSRTKADAVMIRGHNFFKSWNHRISLASDHF